MKHCILCDQEGPLNVGEFTYAWIDLHRATHRLGRQLIEAPAQLLDKLINR